MNIILIIITIISLIFGICGLVYFITNRRANRQLSELKKELFDIQLEYSNVKTDLVETTNIRDKVTEEIKKVNSYLTDKNLELEKATIETHEKEKQLKSLEEVYTKQLNDKKEIIRQELTDSKNKQIEQMQKELVAYSEEIKKQKEQLIEAYNKEKANFDAILQDYQSKRESIIKINKEEEEIRENEKFYTLQINTNDIADIEILERVKPSLSRPDILSKLIYKTYYEKPYTDLVGRVVGTTKKTGIYKITNLKNNKVYIGQAVDIAERWRQHIKRAVGAEPMTTNKLYPIMKETGPYNFSWQIVEECKKEELTAKEKYWIQYYDGQGYGYNIKG